MFFGSKAEPKSIYFLASSYDNPCFIKNLTVSRLSFLSNSEFIFFIFALSYLSFYLFAYANFSSYVYSFGYLLVGLSDILLLENFDDSAPNDFAEFNLFNEFCIVDFFIFLPLLSYYTSSSSEF